MGDGVIKKVFSDLRYIATGEAGEEDEGPSIGEMLAGEEEECPFCHGYGLANAFCPVCGLWDLRTPDELEDEVRNMRVEII